MNINWNYIKLTLLLGILVFLFSFSNQRNEVRHLKHVEVEFTDGNAPFITVNTVNKLLIQNKDTVTSIVKETLVLKEMEYRLLQNPMVRDAEVFVTVSGTLGAKIRQRKPIGRVTEDADFYLDEDGKKMPLSEVYTARVPLITGKSARDFTELTPLLREIEKDAFMREIVVGLEVKKNGSVAMQLRNHEVRVLFGKPEAISKKFQKFKAFFKKTRQDSTLTAYSHINLAFGDQVVATKK